MKSILIPKCKKEQNKLQRKAACCLRASEFSEPGFFPLACPVPCHWGPVIFQNNSLHTVFHCAHYYFAYITQGIDCPWDWSCLLGGLWRQELCETGGLHLKMQSSGFEAESMRIDFLPLQHVSVVETLIKLHIQTKAEAPHGLLQVCTYSRTLQERDGVCMAHGQVCDDSLAEERTSEESTFTCTQRSLWVRAKVLPLPHGEDTRTSHF